jgi:hypothetical protein
VLAVLCNLNNLHLADLLLPAAQREMDNAAASGVQTWHALVAVRQRELGKDSRVVTLTLVGKPLRDTEQQYLAA